MSVKAAKVVQIGFASISLIAAGYSKARAMKRGDVAGIKDADQLIQSGTERLQEALKL